MLSIVVACIRATERKRQRRRERVRGSEIRLTFSIKSRLAAASLAFDVALPLGDYAR